MSISMFGAATIKSKTNDVAHLCMYTSRDLANIAHTNATSYLDRTLIECWMCFCRTLGGAWLCAADAFRLSIGCAVAAR